MFVLVRFKVVVVRDSHTVSVDFVPGKSYASGQAWEAKASSWAEGKGRMRIVGLYGYRLSQKTEEYQEILLSAVWTGRGSGILGNPYFIYSSNISGYIRGMLYLQLNSYNVNIYPILKDLSSLFHSLKPHLRQVLWVEGMAYIIFILLSIFIATWAGKVEGAWFVAEGWLAACSWGGCLGLLSSQSSQQNSEETCVSAGICAHVHSLQLSPS